jgi:hypothetical protein
MTLIRKKFNYTPLSRKELDGKRLYTCPDGSSVSSVTTILGATKSVETTEALENWKNAIGVKRAEEIVFQAASRGTRMHKYLEDYLNGIPLKDSVSNPYAQQSLTMAKLVIKEGLVNFNEYWGSEIPLYYPGLYAGTADGIGIHQNEECIFDFKQTNKVKSEDRVEDYYIQLLFYGTAHNKIYGTNIRKGVILMCSANYEYQEFIISGNKWDQYKDKMWDRIEQFYQEI